MLKTVIAALLVAAQSSSPPPPGAPMPPIPPGRGEIVLFNLTNRAGCPIIYNDIKLIDLKPGKWAAWRVDPGQYVLKSGMKRVSVEVSLNGSRYVECKATGRVGKGIYSLRVSDRKTYDRHLEMLTPQPLLNNP